MVADIIPEADTFPDVFVDELDPSDDDEAGVV